MAGLTVSPYGSGGHKLALLTDNDYRRSRGLSPLERKTDPDLVGKIPDTGEPVIEVDPDLMRQLDAWKQERSAASRRKEELTALIDKAEAELAEQFAAASVKELVIDGRKVSARSTLWLKKRREDVTAAAVAAALRADGLPELVQPEGYNASRLAGWARELEAEGKPLPPHVAELLEGRESWSFSFTSPRPSRAAKRLGGQRSSILHPESGASGD